MAYAVIGDVTGLIAQFPISVGTKPTTAQATAIMTDISNEIDVALSSAGVAVPVTTPDFFLNWLGLLNAYGAAAAVLKSMFPGATGAEETPAYAFWEARYREGLDAIRNGKAIPADTISGTDFVLPSTYLTENPETELDLGTIAEPLFKIGKQF
jgi:hypothetical protein